MPANKYALIRYRVIDRCIGNKYRPYPDIERIQEKCEEALGKTVSRSTIEKDMNAMKNDGALGYEAPIVYSKEYRGYYYTEPDYSIQDVPLSDEEIDAIKIAANTLSTFRDSGPFKQYSSAIDKILDRVEISSSAPENELEELIQFETVPTMKGNEHLSTLFGAARERKTVEFDYGSYRKSGSKKRKVDPYLLKEYRNRWYLIGWSHDKQKVIIYGLDRMENLSLTKLDFVPDPDFDSDLYFKYSIGITANDGQSPQNVEVRVDNLLAKYLQSQPVHHSQELTETKDGFLLKLKVIDTYELREKLLGYGSQVEVLKPASLRNEIKDQLQKTFKKYAK